MALLEAEKSWPVNETDRHQASANLALVNESLESFISEHIDVHDPHQRIDMVLGLSGSLRSILEENEAVQDYTDGITARTQLDILEWEALKGVWFLNSPVLSGIKPPPGIKELRKDEFMARERVLDDIEITHRMSVGNELQAHEELTNQYWRARLAVKNPHSPMVRDKSMDRAILAQHLTVHKSVHGLHDAGFQNARRATLAEKNDGTDVVVPLGKLNVRNIGLKFQPGSRGAEGLSAYAANKILLVNVPQATSENPFIMPAGDQKILASSVNEIRRRVIALHLNNAARAA